MESGDAGLRPSSVHLFPGLPPGGKESPHRPSSRAFLHHSDLRLACTPLPPDSTGPQGPSLQTVTRLLPKALSPQDTPSCFTFMPSPPPLALVNPLLLRTAAPRIELCSHSVLPAK